MQINKIQYEIKVCVQLTTYADNVALPAFARRTPLLLSTDRDRNLLSTAADQQLISLLLCWARQTDGHRTVTSCSA